MLKRLRRYLHWLSAAQQIVEEILRRNGLNKWLRSVQRLKSSNYYPTIYDAESNPTGGIDYAGIDLPTGGMKCSATV